MMTPAAMKAWIDQATTEQLLRKWRFASAGDPFFQGEIGKHFSLVIGARRNADPEEWTRASKRIGW